MSRGLLARAAFVAYLTAAAVLTLSPGREWLLHILRQLQSAALDAGLGWEVAGRIEFVANVLLVVPVPCLGALALNRYGFALWVLAVGFGGSCCIELVQLVLLPNRTASVADVVANTAGALLGWLVARRVGSGSDRSRPDESGAQVIE